MAIKKDFGGLFSTWANESLQVGDRLAVMNPQGAFTSRAAGSGITPIMAIARSVLAATPASTMDLMYANRAATEVMFAEELGDLKGKYPARLAVHHVLSREQRISPLLSGRIDQEKLGQILERVIQADRTDEWFLRGPFELVQLCRDLLAERGVPEEKVRFELFSTGRPEKPEGQQGREVVADPAGENYSISFTLDGTSAEVKSPKSVGETVLNAALRVRPDVPFACAGGVCGTCRAKVIAGEFEMEENFALEADEVQAGYVLTCQTRPCSDSLSVDFDA